MATSCDPSPWSLENIGYIEAAYYLSAQGRLPTGPESQGVDLNALAEAVREELRLQRLLQLKEQSGRRGIEYV